MIIPPRRIVLSGGGIRALAHVGALTVLDKKGLLKSVKEYVGVSAGAFVGFSLMLGYTLSELRTLCALFDFSVLRHFEPEAAFEFPTSFGFDYWNTCVDHRYRHPTFRVACYQDYCGTIHR